MCESRRESVDRLLRIAPQSYDEPEPEIQPPLVVSMPWEAVLRPIHAGQSQIMEGGLTWRIC